MYYNNIKKDRIFFFRRKSTKSTVTLLRRRAQEKDNIHSCNNSCLFSPTSTPLNVLRKNGLSFLTITLLQHFLEKQTFWFLSIYLSLIVFEKGFESIYFISERYLYVQRCQFISTFSTHFPFVLLMIEYFSSPGILQNLFSRDT